MDEIGEKCEENGVKTETRLDKEEIDAKDVFELVKGIKDPEFPLTLEDLNVVEESNVFVDNNNSLAKVSFKPTVDHCSLVTVIGLAIKVKLIRSLPKRFKIDVTIVPGSHNTEEAVNKQLDDKERVAAALENGYLLDIVNQCLEGVVGK